MGFVSEITPPDPTLKEPLAAALNKAKKQLKLRKYETAFKDAGIEHVSQVALAVQGKDLLMKAIKN